MSCPVRAHADNDPGLSSGGCHPLNEGAVDATMATSSSGPLVMFYSFSPPFKLEISLEAGDSQSLLGFKATAGGWMDRHRFGAFFFFRG